MNISTENLVDLPALAVGGRQQPGLHNSLDCCQQAIATKSGGATDAHSLGHSFIPITASVKVNEMLCLPFDSVLNLG